MFSSLTDESCVTDNDCENIIGGSTCNGNPKTCSCEANDVKYDGKDYCVGIELDKKCENEQQCQGQY